VPKLNKKRAKEIEDTEGGGFSLLENGRYLGKLRDVEVKQKEGGEFPYWQWEFDNLRSLDGETTYPGRQWAITSLSPKADFKMKEAFQAFGVPADTDTDELIGEDVILVVGTRTIKEGDRKGEQSNTVNNLLPVGDAGGSEGEDEDDEF
jgi:hypothetical protein